MNIVFYGGDGRLCYVLIRKSRPGNGPGANNLRGGKHDFGEKVTIGGWVESTGGPQHFKRGFTTEEFLTEAQRLQMGTKKLLLYGAEIPNEFQLNRAFDKTNKDIFNPPTKSNDSLWRTSIQDMDKTILNPPVCII